MGIPLLMEAHLAGPQRSGADRGGDRHVPLLLRRSRLDHARDYLVATGGSRVGLLDVALAHGLALAVLASALGAVSGAHFNPAVTLAVWIMGKITVPRALGYVAACGSHSLVGRIA